MLEDKRAIRISHIWKESKSKRDSTNKQDCQRTRETAQANKIRCIRIYHIDSMSE